MSRRNGLLSIVGERLADMTARVVSAVIGRVPADRYRPERHYMRGPGPKCRAKAVGGYPAGER